MERAARGANRPYSTDPIVHAVSKFEAVADTRLAVGIVSTQPTVRNRMPQGTSNARLHSSAEWGPKGRGRLQG